MHRIRSSFTKIHYGVSSGGGGGGCMGGQSDDEDEYDITPIESDEIIFPGGTGFLDGIVQAQWKPMEIVERHVSQSSHENISVNIIRLVTEEKCIQLWP